MSRTRDYRIIEVVEPANPQETYCYVEYRDLDKGSLNRWKPVMNRGDHVIYWPNAKAAEEYVRDLPPGPVHTIVKEISIKYSEDKPT